MKRNGYSLLEALLTLAILTVVVLLVYQLGTPVMTYFQNAQAHQQLNANVRASLDTMTHALELGRATSVRISNGPIAPNSQIDFAPMYPLPNGTTAYSFLLNNRTLEMWEFKVPGPSPTLKPLADNVSGLIFANDASEPAIVYFTLRIDPEDAHSRTASATVQVFNQEIHLAVNP